MADGQWAREVDDLSDSLWLRAFESEAGKFEGIL